MQHAQAGLSSPARVLIIAPHGSYRTAAFIRAAEQLGVPTLIASQGKHSIVSSYAQGLHIDLQQPGQALTSICEEAQRGKFAAVVATDDSTTQLAAAVSERLGLVHNPPGAVETAARKDKARDCLAQHQVSKPAHQSVAIAGILSGSVQVAIDYPLVVKPLALSASRGVIRANNPDELINAVTRIRAILQQEDALRDEIREQVLLESYIPGFEIAVEAMLDQGRLTILTIFDKPDPLEGPYFEETLYLTPTRLTELQQLQVANVIQQACGAYGLVTGPVHAECRINDKGVFILEVAARTIGGLCGRLLQFGTGYSLEELVLAQAMALPLNMQRAAGAAGVMMIPIPKAGLLKRVEGLLEANRVEFITDIDIQVREGYELVPLPEGSSYLGFIFASAESTQQVEQALREAHAKLHFVITPVWKVQAQ